MKISAAQILLLPAVPLKRFAFSIPELHRNSDPDRQVRGTRCLSSFVKAQENQVTYRTSCSGSGKSWLQTIVFAEEDFNSLKGELAEAQQPQTFEHIFSSFRDSLKDAEIQVHCECPDWLYFGLQFIGTRLDYAVKPEHRAPNRKNPNQIGVLCKHLVSVAKTFYS